MFRVSGVEVGLFYAVQGWGPRCHSDISKLSAVRFVYRYVI
jgi:hypothetical protein